MSVSLRVLLFALLCALLLTAAVLAAAAPAAHASGTIAGQLVNDLTGEPVIGPEQTLIYAHYWDEKTKEWTGYESTHASGGHFWLRGLAAGTWRLGVSDRRYGNWAAQFWDRQATAEAADPITITDGAFTYLTVRLQPASRITGTVRNTAGEPLAEVGVGASIWNGTRYRTVNGATSVADGTYDIKGLAAGTYTLEFLDEAGDYVMQYYDGILDWRLATPVVVPAGATVSGIDAVLTPPPAPSFSGLRRYTQALTQVAGKSLPGAKVRVKIDGRTCTRTASDLGAWKVGGLRLAQGRHEVAATASNLAGTGAERTKDVVVDRGRPAVSAARTASCRRGETAVLHFRVRDALSPKVRVTVRIATLSGRTVRTVGARMVQAGAVDLAFKCTLANGTYRFSVSARDLAGNRQIRVASNLLRVR